MIIANKIFCEKHKIILQKNDNKKCVEKFFVTNALKSITSHQKGRKHKNQK